MTRVPNFMLQYVSYSSDRQWEIAATTNSRRYFFEHITSFVRDPSELLLEKTSTCYVTIDKPDIVCQVPLAVCIGEQWIELYTDNLLEWVDAVEQTMEEEGDAV